jgi:NAD(P)-dependent dehydrogenase (short-subunit alcohol dehydrogenase family)
MHFDARRRRWLCHTATLLAFAPLARSARPLAPVPFSANVPEPPTGFGPETSGLAVVRHLDLRGKTLLVTGATSGIGLETMRVLAARGARVIGTARSSEKAVTARAAIGERDVHFVVLDLADFASVRAAAADVRVMAPQLHGLINNAGIVLDGLEQVNGIEKTFVVNHLGHFLLTHELLSSLREAGRARVVTLGSGDHRRAPAGGIQFDDLAGKTWQQRYAHSKLANGLFSAELARREATHGISSVCVSPGHTRTEILRHVGNRFRDDARDVAQGAATPCYAAVHPALDSVSGAYLADFRPSTQSPEQSDLAMARRLWEASERLVGIAA